MLRSLTIAIVTSLLCLATASAVQAQDKQAPPGASAIDQYLETVPDARGSSTVGEGGRPDPGDPGTAALARAALPAASIITLAQRGPSGADAAALAGRTAPAASRTASASSRPLKEPAPASPTAAVGRIAAGPSGDGMGLLFPLLIVGGALAVAGSALWRRRDPEA